MPTPNWRLPLPYTPSSDDDTENNLDAINEIAKNTMRKQADMIDQAAYAYVTKQFDYLVSIGEDPRSYGVVYESFNGFGLDKDGYEIRSRLRVKKIKEDDVSTS